MAIKITTQIGTDKGITSEAYVRISNYQISKYGYANFQLEVFQSQNDVTVISGANMPPLMTGTAQNQQIGNYLQVPLTKEVAKTITVNKHVQVTVPEIKDENGVVTTPSSIQWENQDVQEEMNVLVPDMSSVEAGTIFEFGYSKLKEKLVTLFGAEHIIDC